MVMTKTKQKQSGGALAQRRYTTVILVLITAAGLLGSVAAGLYTSNLMHTQLRQRAADIATSLPSESIQSLTGTPADLDTPAYKSLKEKLARLRKDGPSTRFVYIAGKDDRGMFIYADSEPTTSSEYSPPGKRLPDTSSNFATINQHRQAFTEGPVSDEWGTWVSGVAPIIDTDTGAFVGAVGIDTATTQHYATTLAIAALPLLLAAFPLIAVLRDRKIEQKEREIMQMKTQFVSVASHELRSPLSGMLWAVQSLLKPSVKNLTIEQQVILLDMYQSAEESLATINEILDISAMERDTPQHLSKQRIEIGNIIKTAAKTLRLSANERGIKFSFVGNWNGDDAFIVGDPNALKRMFMNLIANAIKYGKDYTEISIRLLKKEGNYVVAIEDHGIGIPVGEQKRVLEGYYRAENARETKRAGTGLGLHLAKLVAEQHGGKLWLTSKEGRGTTVFVSIPAADAQTKTSR